MYVVSVNCFKTCWNCLICSIILYLPYMSAALRSRLQLFACFDFRGKSEKRDFFRETRYYIVNYDFKKE